MRASGFQFGLTVADAFVRGIRDIGYRSTGTALDELIDNAIQAEADTLLVAFQLDTDGKRPIAIAVIDNGYGMSPTMCRLAAIWGGTHRENDRTGFGRYGYGLPSACVSLGRRFTIFSRRSRGSLHGVTFDIEDLAEGRYTDGNGRVAVPMARRAQLPDWIAAHIREHMPSEQLEHGTVILIEKLDHLTRATSAGLARHLVEHFGVVYRNWLTHVPLRVQGAPVEPIDPLFLTPGSRFYDLDDERPQSFEPIEIPVADRDSGEIMGTLRVRYAVFPPTFASVDKAKGAIGRNANPRFPIMASHNGIIFLRMGRQIDVVTRGLGAPFQNNDRYWKVEVDFPPTLDEEFGVSTSKQRIEVSRRIWDVLRQAGVDMAINQLRRLNAEARTQAGPPDSGYLVSRPSEIAMGQRTGLQPPIWPTATSACPHDTDAAEQPRLGASRMRCLECLATATAPVYKISLDAIPGAPFFRSERLKETVKLVLNTAHPFFTDLYAASDTTFRLRSALEVMLLTLDECDATHVPDSPHHVDIERWSACMATALTGLSDVFGWVSGQDPRDADGTVATAGLRRRP